MFIDKNVLVTAGASGIGRCIAEAFIAQGANVHVADVNQTMLDDFLALNPESHVSLSDVSDEAAVDRLFETQAGIGDLHVLINCAGIKGPTESVENMQYADWQQCVAVNLDAAFLCSRRAIPMLKRSAIATSSRSSIVNMSSTAGWHGYPLRSPYSAAKWGLIGLTKSLAMELGTEGVRVNVICPGTVDGDRMDRVIADEAKLKNVSEQSIRDGYTKGCSLREMILGEDIADSALFLSSDAARKITGQALSVDGHLESFAVS